EGHGGAVSPDGRWSAEGGWGFVRLWDAESGWPAWTALVSRRSILALAVDAGARRLAAAGEGGRVWILDVSSGRDRELDSLGAGSLSVAWTPDERELAVSGFDGVVRVIDVETGRLLRTLGEPG